LDIRSRAQVTPKHLHQW